MSDKFIPLCVPNIKGNELEYITQAIQSEWVSTAGPDIASFEKEFSEYLDVKNVCAIQSGTAGLHLCFRHFGIGENDIVLVPTLTFIATINPILYQNAEPIFFDCDEHLCINVLQVKNYLENECEIKSGKTIDKLSGKHVKAICPVHIFGDYADMNTLMPLAEKYNLIVIEDATESLGTKITQGTYQNCFTGCIGHAGVFSFNGNKVMTTGGGGLVVSKDKSVVEHIHYLSQQAKDDAVYFVNNEVGYNYRMTNLQAALGRGQLERLDDFIQTKRANWFLYQEKLQKIGYQMIAFHNPKTSNCWFYSLLTNSKNPSVRDDLIQYLSEHKIQTRPIWTLNHKQKPFLNFRKQPCPNAEKIYNKVVNLPCSSNLTPQDVDYVCSVISTFKSREG